MRQPGKYLGRSTANVDGFLERIHGALAGVSRVLAADVVSVLANTKGVDALAAQRPAYLSSYFSNPFGYSFGSANFHMTQLDSRLEMALRLMKSDLASAIHVA